MNLQKNCCFIPEHQLVCCEDSGSASKEMGKEKKYAVISKKIAKEPVCNLKKMDEESQKVIGSLFGKIYSRLGFIPVIELSADRSRILVELEPDFFMMPVFRRKGSNFEPASVRGTIRLFNHVMEKEESEAREEAKKAGKPYVSSHSVYKRVVFSKLKEEGEFRWSKRKIVLSVCTLGIFPLIQAVVAIYRVFKTYLYIKAMKSYMEKIDDKSSQLKGPEKEKLEKQNIEYLAKYLRLIDTTPTFLKIIPG